MLLEVKKIKAGRDDKEIIKGVNLKIKKGEVQALLGPNASGKSTLAQLILGNPKFKVTEGEIFLNGEKITKMPPEKRVESGLVLSWQNPPAIKGVKFLKLLEKISKEKIKPERFSETELLEREVNVDFSGGEKKISELLQILSLKPKLVIFDEIDSGLDLKRLEKVSKIIKKELVDKGVSILVITHSGEILKFLKPAKVNIMVGGKIICRGENYLEVLKTIKKYGYEKCKEKCKKRLRADRQ